MTSRINPICKFRFSFQRNSTPWTNSAVTVHPTAGQITTIMRADVFQREIFPVEIEYGDIRTVKLNYSGLSVRYIAFPGSYKPFVHDIPSKADDTGQSRGRDGAGP
jgi:hypothetical protein